MRDQVSHPYDATLLGYFEVYGRKERDSVQFLTKYYLIFEIINTDLPLWSDRDWRRMFVFCDVFKDAVHRVRPDWTEDLRMALVAVQSYL